MLTICRTQFPDFLSFQGSSRGQSKTCYFLLHWTLRLARRRRGDFFKSKSPQATWIRWNFLRQMIYLYHFQEVRPKGDYTYSDRDRDIKYDGVIHHFREVHLSSWPLDGLEAAAERLHSLCPTRDIQIHLLHLASYGDILPHVDNLELG
jgi:hypothetical protein